MWCSGLYCAGVKGQGPDLRGHTTRIPQSLDIMTWPCDLQQRWLCCVVSRSCLLCGIICQHVKKAADKTWGESRGRGEGSDKSMEFLHVPLWYLSLTNPPLRPPPTPLPAFVGLSGDVFCLQDTDLFSFKSLAQHHFSIKEVLICWYQVTKHQLQRRFWNCTLTQGYFYIDADQLLAIF